MRERSKYWSHDKQDENDNCNQVCKENRRIAPTSQRSIGYPDSNKAVNCGKCIADGGIFVLNSENSVSQL